jgi:DNA-binding XRE family transcriptional regulator
MIQDELEYNVTKERLVQLDEFIAYLKSPDVETDPEVHPLLPQIEIQAHESLRYELLKELAEYEGLRDGTSKTIQVKNLSELPTVLVKARIAAGLSQKELAEKLGVEEREVRSFEKSNYKHATLACLCKVGEVLQVKLTGNLEFQSLLENPNATPELATPVTAG